MVSAGRTISAEDLAEDVVRFVYKKYLAREAAREELEYQSKFLLDRRVSVEMFSAAIAQTPEGQRLRNGAETSYIVDGCTFTIPSDSFLAHWLASQPRGYEWWALPHFLELCRPGITVVDIGANWGIYAIPAARRVGPLGKVFAFEASRDNAKILRRNVVGNRVDNLELMAMAISDRFGSAMLPVGPATNSGYVILDPADAESPGVDCHPVATLPLDCMRGVLGRVCLIKMDIEGAEYRACKGASAILREDRPVVFIEFAPLLLSAISKVDAADLLKMFLDLSYLVDLLHRERHPERVAGDHSEVIQRVMAQCDEKNTHIDLRLVPRVFDGSDLTDDAAKMTDGGLVQLS